MEYYEKATSTNGDTGKGNALKRLKHITCPYTGIRMISGSEMNRIEQKLKEYSNLNDKLFLLSRYAKNMQVVEHRIFDHINYFLDSNPKMNLLDYFHTVYDYHLKKLKLEEFKVIDSVDTKSSLLSITTQLELRKETTKCRNQILDSSSDVFFKRKTFLFALDEIKALNPYEERVLEEIKNLALFLPTSGSSENAFIVKYSRRSEYDILRRLLIGSVATIEHVKPHSNGGRDVISNFLMVSNNGNKYRENIPLSVYIDRNPAIPEYCQIHIMEIINNIHRGGLKGNESYPYKIKKTLFDESEGRILLDLSSYRLSEEKAAYLEEEYKKAKMGKWYVKEN
ncbi:MAG: hypothetical protein K6G51_05980 [Sphaerochaetaceae bacterium]|nr:hypothetical protein [Sphaerochaetaceae bacterium]